MCVEELTTFKGLVCKAIGVLNGLIPLLFLVATVVFLWGIVQFISAADNKEKREDGKQFIIYGLIGLFIMVAIWGLVNVLLGTFFGAGIENPPGLPSGPEI